MTDAAFDASLDRLAAELDAADRASLAFDLEHKDELVRLVLEDGLNLESARHAVRRRLRSEG